MYSLNCKGRVLVIDEPIVMGILNVTPDSFFEGSRVSHLDEIVQKAGLMIEDGAAVLDIGGQSTRPGSKPVSAEEELERVLPAIEAVHKNFPQQIISIDTFYASVVKAAVNAGASVVNDVSAGSIDDQLLLSVAQMKVPYVIMHMKGHPQTMQHNPVYNNVVLDVFDFLNFKMDELTRLGVNDIIIDPGFGFGKTIQHNFQLLKNLSFFQKLGKPLMVGLSRKATVYKTLGVLPTEAMNGTTVIHTMALMNGAQILRVHDVKEAAQAIKLLSVYNNKE